MDIAGLSVAMASVSVQNAYGVAMLSKSLDQVSSMGDQITGMMDAAAMELSVNPEIGANVDIRI
ncbi:MAG: YjfB family protein [Lachnospiraceae bacterium]